MGDHHSRVGSSGDKNVKDRHSWLPACAGTGVSHTSTFTGECLQDSKQCTAADMKVAAGLEQRHIISAPALWLPDSSILLSMIRCMALSDKAHTCTS